MTADTEDETGDSVFDIELNEGVSTGPTHNLFAGDTIASCDETVLPKTSLTTLSAEKALEVQRFYSSDLGDSGNDNQIGPEKEGEQQSAHFHPPYGSASAEYFSENGGFSLSGLLDLFEDKTVERIFAGGILVEISDEHLSGLTLIPFFAGRSAPGAGILISILDEVGSEAGRASVTADPAGNWVACMPEVILHDHGYTIQLVQTPVSWADTAGQNSEPIETFFVGANLAPPATINNPVLGKILGGVLKGKSALEMVEELTREEEY